MVERAVNGSGTLSSLPPQHQLLVLVRGDTTQTQKHAQTHVLLLLVLLLLLTKQVAKCKLPKKHKKVEEAAVSMTEVSWLK